jgi:hypothetical protein
MDGQFFARMTPNLAKSSRRRILNHGSAGILGMVGSRLGATDGSAKKRKKKRKKQKQSPPLQLAFRCPGPPTFIGFCSDECRAAQVFRTTRGGRLSRVQVHIDKPNGSTGDYVVQLLRVNNSDTPLHAPLDILAATTVADADVPTGESQLTASFAGPFLEAETDYAVAVGRVGNQVRIGTVSGTTCGGQIFSAHGLEPFDPSNSDLVVSGFVG